MRIFLAALGLFLAAGAVLAGPNANGVLIVHDTGRRLSATLYGGWLDICREYAVPSSCGDAVTRIDGSSTHYGDPEVFRVYASFPEGSSPRLMGLTWGVDYDAAILSVPNWTNCGDFELNDPGFPAPGTGSSVVYNVPQTAMLTPVYWFAAYNDGTPTTFDLIPNPSQGGWLRLLPSGRYLRLRNVG